MIDGCARRTMLTVVRMRDGRVFKTPDHSFQVPENDFYRMRHRRLTYLLLVALGAMMSSIASAQPRVPADKPPDIDTTRPINPEIPIADTLLSDTSSAA